MNQKENVFTNEQCQCRISIKFQMFVLRPFYLSLLRQTHFPHCTGGSHSSQSWRGKSYETSLYFLCQGLGLSCPTRVIFLDESFSLRKIQSLREQNSRHRIGNGRPPWDVRNKRIIRKDTFKAIRDSPVDRVACWIDHNGVASSIELLEWGRTNFRDLGRQENSAKYGFKNGKIRIYKSCYRITKRDQGGVWLQNRL